MLKQPYHLTCAQMNTKYHFDSITNPPPQYSAWNDTYIYIIPKQSKCLINKNSHNVCHTKIVLSLVIPKRL